jgi:hypothetical protein
MVSIGLAARLWAKDHNGYLPSDLKSISNELVSTKILVCPGDQNRQPAESWQVLSAIVSSYEIVTTNLIESDTNEVFLRCKIHAHLGFGDGTVFDGVRRRAKAP